MLPHRIDEKRTNSGGKRARSNSSHQMNRRLCLSYLLGLLLLVGHTPGRCCWAFQNLHYSPKASSSSSSSSTSSSRLGAAAGSSGSDLRFSPSDDDGSSRSQERKPLLKKVLGAVKPNRWRRKNRLESSSVLEAAVSTDNDSDSDDDSDSDSDDSAQDETSKEAARKEAIAKLKAEVESKRASEKQEREQQAEQDDALKRAEAEVARLRSEAQARKKAEEAAAKAAAKAEAEAKRMAAEDEKKRLAAEKKAQDVATLLKAKEEAARVMAEIDAKLRAETAQADEEEAERVARLQAEALESPPTLDDADDELLARMMEEMEKVRIELDSRIQAEEEEQEQQQQQKEEEDEKEKAAAAAAAKTWDLAGGLSPDLVARIQRGASYEPPAAAEKQPPAPVDSEEEVKQQQESEPSAAVPPKQPMPDLTKPVYKSDKAPAEESEPPAAVPPKQPIPDLTIPVSKSDKAPTEAVVTPTKGSASDEEEAPEPTPPPPPPPPKQPMPDLTPPTSKKNVVPDFKAANSQSKESKPKWMVDWKNETTKEKEDEATKAESKTNEEAKSPESTRIESTKEEEEKKEEKVRAKEEEEKVDVAATENTSEKDQPDDGKQKKGNNDPRTVGRNSRENLFDVIGRTAGSSISMDEMTKKKQEAAQQQKQKQKQKRSSPKPLEAEVMTQRKDDELPSSFGESVAASYKTGQEKRPMPDDLYNIKELKKKGPPADFGSFAAAASGKQSGGAPPNSPAYDVDKGPPASFGASVAIASSGDVPQDLLSRGTASTDAGVSSPPSNSSKSSTKKRTDDSNIIDVVDVVYTKKDEPSKPKKTLTTKKKASKSPAKETKTPPPPQPMNVAPPLQVEKTVPPLRNEPKGKKEENPNAKEASKSKIPFGTVNTSKNAAENSPIFGTRKPETEIQEPPQKQSEPKETGEVPQTKSETKEKAMEERVAELLKEAFSLSKEDSRVADLLQGVVAITTGADKKEETASTTKNSSKGSKNVVSDDDDDDGIDDIDVYDPAFEDDDEENTVIMGRTRTRNPMEDPNGFRRNDPRPNPPRRKPPIRRIESIPVENEWGEDGYIETPIISDKFDDYDGDGYFEDDESDYFEYDENDTWRGRDPLRQPPPPAGRYSVRPPPPPPGMDQSGFESEEDYYFLKFGGPRSPYDEPVDDMYYDDKGDYWDDDDDDDGVRPGEPRPAYSTAEVDDVKKGPPSNFGNFVAGVSMAKTGFAPTSIKTEVDDNGGSSGGTTIGPDGDEWGDEMAMNTGGMLTPKGARINGSGGGGGASPRGAPPQSHFVVSEDQSGGSDGGKKGPPSSFGNAVGSAGEMQTGVNPMQRSVEEEIANGGMATPTGMMATPRRKAPSVPQNNPPAPGAGAGQGTVKKPLFIVSEDDAGTPDFGSSVAEASGARTGWAPKAPKRSLGGLESGTTGGMRPKLQKPASGNNPQRQEFGSAVFDACPTVDTGSAGSPNAKRPASQGDPPPPTKQSSEPDLMDKQKQNPAVKLLDGGSSKAKPPQVRYSGTMMAPRIVRRQNPGEETNEE